MELRHLRYFTAVAEELSFTRAAQRLNTSQPSLSQQIRDLEEEVGTSLFHRTSRAVVLTNAGTIFLQEARLLLTASQQAITKARQAADEQFNRLVIGVIPSAEYGVLPSILPFLRSHYPHIELELSSKPTREQLRCLASHETDAAFVRGSYFDDCFEHQMVMKESLQVVLPYGHPLAHSTAIAVQDLAMYPYVALAVDADPQFLEGVVDFFSQQHVSLRQTQSTPMHLLGMTLVGMGNGFSILPSSAKFLLVSNIVCRPLVDSPVLDLNMVWRKNDQRPVLQCFRDLVAQMGRSGAKTLPTIEPKVHSSENSEGNAAPPPSRVVIH